MLGLCYAISKVAGKMKKGKVKKTLIEVIPLPTRVKKAKKDRDFKPAWKKDFAWFTLFNETEGENVLPVLCKFSKQ